MAPNKQALLRLENRDVEKGSGEETTPLFDKKHEWLPQQQSSLVLESEERKVEKLLYNLFIFEQHSPHHHPLTSPELPPERRFTRHRNYYIYQLNQFRHWWKTSRLLVRLSGGIVFCQDQDNWSLMAALNVLKRKQARKGVKFLKKIGRGGPTKPFLAEVHPFTRTIRIILAIARGWEARVDNRLVEVGIAEAFAFMGNRCFRFWARKTTDWMALHIAFPLSGTFLAAVLDQKSRPVIVAFGFVRAILPFALSFQGSRFGRQLTYNTYKYANYRWRSVMSIMHFHELAGTYRDMDLDAELLALIRASAGAIGRSKDPKETRRSLAQFGFNVFGSGYGGRSVYRLISDDKIITMHVTPYGPSILDELPMFVILERRRATHIARDPSDASMLDAASKCEATICGYTYSGAFFQSQEWAALKTRYDREMENYNNACRFMGTATQPGRRRDLQFPQSPAPPMDLVSLKTFLRMGRPPWKQRRDDKTWKIIQKEVKHMASRVKGYQNANKAPPRVILYLEGLDCSGKSSTGMLICDALKQCGYSVDVAQHNRPPTPEQREKPWMDRGRFEHPDDMLEEGTEAPDYASLVWDRGPLGDFVYGNLDELPVKEKLKRYREFREYDYKCRRDGILFFKTLFVADKDSIAKTLGKRLAHRKIARDLRSWLDANNAAEQFREGLEEIEAHIDPTDFVAFNQYESNLKKFSEVARNTDYGGIVDENNNSIGHCSNPWLVVNTSDRFKARMGIMKTFEKQIKKFSRPDDHVSIYARTMSFFGKDMVVEQYLDEPVPNDIVEQKEHGISLRALLQSFILLMLLYQYIWQTWKVTLLDSL